MKTQKNKKIFCKQNIPNILVVVRMVLAVVVVVLLLLNHYLWANGSINPTLYKLETPKWWPGDVYVSQIKLLFILAGVFFVIASFTDWLDGFLARKYNWVSDFGKFWDPIADKVLINSTLICFAWSGFITVVIPVIIIARDVITDASKMVAAKKNVVVAANYWGKLKTVLQMAGIIVIFFFFANRGFDASDTFYWSIQQILLYCATVMSVVSGVIYLIQINKSIKQNKHAKQN